MAISPEQIKRLAEVYDRYANAFKPLSKGTEQARTQFNALLGQLHQAHASDTDYVEFRRKAVALCWQYLKKNR
ncbi:MAG: hypothetical protein LBK99_16255 [Opitutaceae bacterium]|jgi:DnaJ-domain-containing protein 1|nr:hypothetical protein [Opitutaceae bacterium]